MGKSIKWHTESRFILFSS